MLLKFLVHIWKKYYKTCLLFFWKTVPMGNNKHKGLLIMHFLRICLLLCLTRLQQCGVWFVLFTSSNLMKLHIILWGVFVGKFKIRKLLGSSHLSERNYATDKQKKKTKHQIPSRHNWGCLLLIPKFNVQTSQKKFKKKIQSLGGTPEQLTLSGQDTSRRPVALARVLPWASLPFH